MCGETSVVMVAGSALLASSAALDPELQRLAGLYVAVATQSKAQSTIASYSGPWQQFQQWLASRPHHCHLQPVQVPGDVVAMYLMHLLDTSRTDGIGPSRVLTASNAISCFTGMHGLEPPTSHPLCVAVRELARRLLHPTRVHKDAVDAKDIHQLVAHFIQPATTLLDLMHVTAIVVMYAGMLRFDDLAEICVHEDLLKILPTHMEIFIPRSKTDQHWEGVWATISAMPGSPVCPVALVTRLLAVGQYRTQPSVSGEDVGPLLRPVRMISGKHVLGRLVGTTQQPVLTTSYDTFRKRVAELFAMAGVRKHITPHSMRIGGATEAAAAGCPDRLIMKFGRWKSEPVKNGYVRESLDALLLVSKSILEA